jgi:peptide/nickel transport system ATP-binding protein
MALRVENLRIYYRTLRGYVHAVEGATFSVGDGEIMGLAGESGCGKTTLGHSLIYLKPPMAYIEGRVFLDGRELPIWDMDRMNEFRFRHISIIPQYAMNALNPTRRIGPLIADLLATRGIDFRQILPELQRRLDLVQLSPEVLNRYPFELSGGMRQRVVMVISTLLNPSLLIADEITSALDVSTQRAVCEMIVEFRNRGFVRSTIFITHDMSILYQIADTILVMYAGQLAEKAPVEAIFRSPRHPYTRMLIASLPRVGARQRVERLKGIPGSPPPLLDPLPGCRFRDRCPLAFERCQEPPPFVEVEPGHFVACWREI